MMESVKAKKDRTTGHHTHIWVKREVLKNVVAMVGHRVFSYVCRCGETGMPIR